MTINSVVHQMSSLLLNLRRNFQFLASEKQTLLKYEFLVTIYFIDV